MTRSRSVRVGRMRAGTGKKVPRELRRSHSDWFTTTRPLAQVPNIVQQERIGKRRDRLSRGVTARGSSGRTRPRRTSSCESWWTITSGRGNAREKGRQLPVESTTRSSGRRCLRCQGWQNTPGHRETPATFRVKAKQKGVGRTGPTSGEPDLTRRSEASKAYVWTTQKPGGGEPFSPPWPAPAQSPPASSPTP